MNVKNLVRPWIHSLEPYPPGKPIDELEREYGVTDSIKLASNENPLGPSPKALAAVQAALAELHRYPDGSCYHLRRALARKLRVSPESLIFGNGSNEIIELIVRTFLHAGEEAVMADQAFVIYRMLVQAQGGTRRSSCRCATSPTTSRRWPTRSRRRRGWSSSPTRTTRPAPSSSATSGRSSSPPCRATW